MPGAARRGRAPAMLMAVMKTFIILLCGLALIHGSLLGAEVIQASEFLRLHLSEQRASISSNINGVVYRAITDRSIGPSGGLLGVDSEVARPLVVPRKGLPVSEVISVIRIHRPVVFANDPRGVPSPSFGDIIVVQPSPTNRAVGLGLGSVVVDPGAVGVGGLKTYHYFEMMGLRILEVPNVNKVVPSSLPGGR